MLSAIVNKNNLAILFLALAAGFLISVFSFSIIVLVAFFVFLWLCLEKFDDIVLLLILYLPFQVALNVAAGFDVASGRVFILLLFIIWIFRSLKNKKLEIDFSLQTLLMIIFLCLATFSFGRAFETDRALRKLLVLYSVFPLYFILASFSGRYEFIMRAARYMFMGGFILSIFGILQFAVQFVFGINPLFDFFSKVIAPVFYGNTFAAEVVANPSWLVNVGGITILRAFAIFPDPHIFSFYLGLIIPPVFAFLFLDKNDMRAIAWRGSKTLLCFVFSALVLSELFTFSRGGYLGMAAGLFAMIALFWKHFAVWQKRAMFVCLVLIMLLASFTNNSVFTRFLSSFDLREGSNVERIKNWQQGWGVFSDNLWGGVGIGNYSFYMDPTVEYRTPIYAHNLYLDLGAEMGVFTLIIWVLLILITICELYRASCKTNDKPLSYLALGLIGSLVWYSVHSLFDDSFFSPVILSVLVVIISLATLVIRYVKMEKSKW